MAIYVIGYDLHPTRGETYEQLIGEIKSLGGWWHCLDSTWLVNSNLTAEQIRDRLRERLKSDDQLLVVTYSRPAAWFGFSGDCQDWLKNNL